MFFHTDNFGNEYPMKFDISLNNQDQSLRIKRKVTINRSLEQLRKISTNRGLLQLREVSGNQSRSRVIKRSP